jgi:hypothetical protein
MSLVTEHPGPSASAPQGEHQMSRSWTMRQRRSGRLRRLGTENGLVFLVALAAYITTMVLLDLVFNIFPLDAVSRMANGFYVLYSRDPHLAAIGFVWNPLQSIAVIPVLLFKDLWPALASHDVSAGIVSALASAGAVYQIHAALRELGLRRAPRLLLTIGFGLNPMIIYYAGNGMSEALYTFTLVATARYLLRWIREDDARSLVYAAVALSLAYLDRNEAVGSAVVAGLLVLILSFSRATGDRRLRIMSAATDGAIFLVPVVTTFTGWAVASFVIKGQPFAQFTSQYGNSSQIATSGTHYTLTTRALYVGHSIEYLAPLLPIVFVVAIALGLKRRDAQVLGVLAVLGGSLAFDGLGVIANYLVPWYRFFLIGVPLDVLLVGCVLSASPSPSAPPSSTVRRTPGTERRAPLQTITALVFVIVVIGSSIPASAIGMFSANVHGNEAQELGALLLPHPDLQDRQYQHHYPHILSIDAYIDRMHLRGGSIVVDTFGNCTPQIVTTVANPKVFVITSDRDFKQVLADPLTFGAHYLLDPQPVGVDALDALNVAYPNLYKNGAGFATRVHEFPSDGICSNYRLLRVVGHPPGD